MTLYSLDEKSLLKKVKRKFWLRCRDKGLSLLDLIYSNLFGNDLFLKGLSKSRSCSFFDFFHRLNDFMHKRVNAPIVNQLNKTLIESILVSMSGFAMLIIQWKNSAIWNIIILQKSVSSSGLSIPRKLKGFVIISGLSFIDFDFRIANVSQEKGTMLISRKITTLLSPMYIKSTIIVSMKTIMLATVNKNLFFISLVIKNALWIMGNYKKNIKKTPRLLNRALL